MPTVEVKEVLNLVDVKYHYDAQTDVRSARATFSTARQSNSHQGQVPAVNLEITFNGDEVEKLLLTKQATITLESGDQTLQPIAVSAKLDFGTPTP
jgi:hypothetical protein